MANKSFILQSQCAHLDLSLVFALRPRFTCNHRLPIEHHMLSTFSCCTFRVRFAFVYRSFILRTTFMLESRTLTVTLKRFCCFMGFFKEWVFNILFYVYTNVNRHPFSSETPCWDLDKYYLRAIQISY